MSSTYSPVLSGNIMLVGGTETGKTSYLQEIILNGFLPKTIKKIYWVSGIYLDEKRIKELTSNFSNYNPKFTHVPDNTTFNKVLNNLKVLPESNNKDNSDSDSDNASSEIDDSNENNNLETNNESTPEKKRLKNFIGENVISNSLVVFDDITKVVEKFGDFVHFLTICRKLGYTCIYIMHSLKAKWIPIMEQTKNFVFFKTAAITATMTNFMRDQAVQINKKSYRTGRKNWVYQVFMDQVQRGSFQSHLLLDIRRLNEKTPPALIRGQTNNPVHQTCYFVSQDNDNDYDTYVSHRINKDIFKIKTSVGKTNFGDRYSLDAGKNLRRINNDSRTQGINYSSSSSSSKASSQESEESEVEYGQTTSKRRKKRRNNQYGRGKPKWLRIMIKKFFLKS